jgi:HlyD family secretion protein
MKNKKSSKKIIWLIIGVVVLGVVATFIINGINARKAANANLQTQVLEKGNLTAIIGATGSVRANQTATVAWQTSGRIEQINNRIGDKPGSSG